MPRAGHVQSFCRGPSFRPCRNRRHARSGAARPRVRAVAEGVAGAAPTFERDSIEQGVLMQGFGWDSCDAGGWYNELKKQIQDIKDIGITFVWLPPPSQSVSRQGYMPSQLYDFNTPYGSADDLRRIVAEFNAAGVGTLADIVINHRCADERDESGRWNTFTDKVEHPGKSVAWGKWAIVGGDGYGGSGRSDSGHDFEPAPDLDHHNDEVRASLKDWLSFLHSDVGFHGWRLDYVKGYSPHYAREYISDTVTCGNFNVGEYWTDMLWGSGGLEWNQDPPRQELCDFIDEMGGCCTMFDFPLKGILQEAVRNVQYGRLNDGTGKPPGLIGWWPQKAVTFLDNHDTGSTQQHWPFPGDRVMAGYAYLMTHPGMPCVLHEHVYKWGLRDGIKQLVELRRRNGIHMRSKVEIKCSDNDMYVACVDGKVTLKMGPRGDMGNLLPRKDDGWRIAASGMDFAIWEKVES